MFCTYTLVSTVYSSQTTSFILDTFNRKYITIFYSEDTPSGLLVIFCKIGYTIFSLGRLGNCRRRSKVMELIFPYPHSCKRYYVLKKSRVNLDIPSITSFVGSHRERFLKLMLEIRIFLLTLYILYYGTCIFGAIVQDFYLN